MIWEGYLVLGGVELLNAERTRVYAGKLGAAPACGCPGLPAALGDEPYVDPATDRAAWFDRAAPESKDFAGLFGLELTGASDGGAQRPWTELLGDGGRPGGLRQNSREIEVKAVAIAATDEALSYGTAWLAAALRGSEDDTCAGDELCALAACPGQTRSLDPCSTDPAPARPSAGDLYDEGTRLLRHLHGVNLMTGPTVEEHRRMYGVSLATVSFTLKSGYPWWYREPARVLDTATHNPERVDWIDDYDILGNPCSEPRDCLTDSPFCRDNGPWGDEPFPGWSGHDAHDGFLDPCYPVTPFDALREIYQISDLQAATWLDKAPVMQFYSGSQPLKRLTVRWYPNPQDYAPSRRLDPCTSCAELTVPWIPSRTTLTLDGRTHTATVDCRGAAGVSSNVNLYGPRGGIYQWPTFTCGVPMLCEVLMHRGSAAEDRHLVVDFAPREDAS